MPVGGSVELRPVITAELFEVVQERLAMRQAMVKKTNNRYLLTGFAKCGSPVVGGCMARNHRYYRCRATVPTTLGPAACDALYIRADWLEPVVRDNVAAALRNPAVLIADLRHHLWTGRETWGRRLGNYAVEIAEMKSQQRRLLEQRQKDFIDQDILESQIGPVQALGDGKERPLRVLEEQQRRKDDAAEAETAHRRVLPAVGWQVGLSEL